MRHGLTIIFQLLFLIAAAQNNIQPFRNFSTREGLSNNDVHCVIKDSRGFLWIGTAEGLNRFDGSRFRQFFSDKDLPGALSSNKILDILEYQPGQLLIATNTGLSVFNTLTDAFENEKIPIPELQKEAGNIIWNLFMDNRKRILINYSGRIDVFNDHLKFLYRLTDLDWARCLQGISTNKEHWQQDSKGRIWIPSGFGICMIDESKKTAYNFKHNPENYPFFTDRPIRGFFYDEPEQTIWYSEWTNGLQKYDFTKKKPGQQLFNLPFANETRCINTITKTKTGKLICGSGQGIYKVDPQTLAYDVVTPDRTDIVSSLITARTACSDNAYTWIGTETMGLLQLSADDSYMSQVMLPFAIRDYTNYCYGIVHDPNGLFYLAYGLDGLVEMDPMNRKVQNYKLLGPGKKPERVYRLIADRGQHLLIGTTHGLYVFDKKEKRFSRPQGFPSFVNDLDISYMFVDSRKNIWFSFMKPALAYYDVSQNKFYYYQDYIVDGKAVFDARYRISRMKEDEDGNIWMISSQRGGILCHNLVSGAWNRYPRSSKNSSLLSDKELNSICIAGDHSVWLSNLNGLGLARYYYKNDSLLLLTRKNGLLSDNILSISKDPGGNLYLVSEYGINFFNPGKNEIRSLTPDDRNINWSYAFSQFYDSADNQLVYGLNDRIVLIKNEAWQAGSGKLQTYIDHISVNNEAWHINPATEQASLKYFQKNIAISFSGNSYRENTSLSYAYKMDGLEKDWTISPVNGPANYSNLPAGEYTFMVKARDQWGEWGPVNSSLRILIAPAYWQTWWFWLIMVTAIILAITLLVRRRIKYIHQQADLKQKISETEMVALRAQMNPHFIFNCISAIDNLIQTSQKDKATAYLTRFAKLIRAVLDSSKNNLIPFYKDYESLKLFLELEQFRYNNEFEYRLYADPEILNSDIKVPPLIIQPFVENAIHHGLMNKQNKDRKLDIHVGLENDYLKYTITDNGIGRQKGQTLKAMNKPEHISYGIDISTKRVHLHNHNGLYPAVVITDIENGQIPGGTRVELWLSVK